MKHVLNGSFSAGAIVLAGGLLSQLAAAQKIVTAPVKGTPGTAPVQTSTSAASATATPTAPKLPTCPSPQPYMTTPPAGFPNPMVWTLKVDRKGLSADVCETYAAFMCNTIHVDGDGQKDTCSASMFASGSMCDGEQVPQAGLDGCRRLKEPSCPEGMTPLPKQGKDECVPAATCAGGVPYNEDLEGDSDKCLARQLASCGSSSQLCSDVCGPPPTTVSTCVRSNCDGANANADRCQGSFNGALLNSVPQCPEGMSLLVRTGVDDCRKGKSISPVCPAGYKLHAKHGHDACEKAT